MKTFISNITVEWVHCDADGIVFYPHFYVWFDQGTERLFKTNGLSYQVLSKKYNVFGMPRSWKAGQSIKMTANMVVSWRCIAG